MEGPKAGRIVSLVLEFTKTLNLVYFLCDTIFDKNSRVGLEIIYKL